MEVIVISGSRADRGPLWPVVEALRANYLVLKEIKCVNSEDVAASAGAAINQVVDYHTRSDTDYDFGVVLGDRHEILGAASALYLLRIPVVHLSGGDITEGSQDNAIRDAITKLAHIHFPTNEYSAKRIIKLGEETWRVKNVGCPGIDRLKQIKLMSKEELALKLGIRGDFILVNYQVPTLAPDPIAEAERLIDALYMLKLPCVVATVNPECFSTHIQEMFTNYCKGRGALLEMTQPLYLSAMKHCKFMIGNSSSAFYEAPTLKTRCVNVGDRQKGRIQPANVVSCSAIKPLILNAVDAVLRVDMSTVENPYGFGDSAQLIKQCLEGFKELSKSQLLIKR